MVDNNYIDIKHDLYNYVASYILYILVVFAVNPAKMVGTDYID